jgi:hypothetical protein
MPSNTTPDPKTPADDTPATTPEDAKKAHDEALLEEALEESFPASDPIAIDVTH